MEAINVDGIIYIAGYEHVVDIDKRPDNIPSVIGYDNQEVSWLLYPTLTTVPLTLVELGDAATTWIINKCENKEKEEDNRNINFTIAGVLIERESVVRIK